MSPPLGKDGQRWSKKDNSCNSCWCLHNATTQSTTIACPMLCDKQSRPTTPTQTPHCRCPLDKFKLHGAELETPLQSTSAIYICSPTRALPRGRSPAPSATHRRPRPPRSLIGSAFCPPQPALSLPPASRLPPRRTLSLVSSTPSLLIGIVFLASGLPTSTHSHPCMWWPLQLLLWIRSFIVGSACWEPGSHFDYWRKYVFVSPFHLIIGMCS